MTVNAPAAADSTETEVTNKGVNGPSIVKICAFPFQRGNNPRTESNFFWSSPAKKYTKKYFYSENAFLLVFKDLFQILILLFQTICFSYLD